MTNPSSPRMYLVDGHSLLFQVFHAIRDRMTSPSGLPTNAVYGFTRDLLYLRQQKPAYLVCAFDREERTFRSEMYPDYKAHREPMPTDLQLQVPLVAQAVEALGVPIVSYPGYEADDVIATIARAASRQGIEVLICTSDKDCRQLIDDRVRLYNLRKRLEMGRKELEEDWGIRPEQVVDLQTLVGDSVDNVPGVPGIGYKTAARLLQEFGTLDQLLTSIDRVAGAKKQESLRAAAPLLEISRKLVRLADDVPIPLEWEKWRLREIDRPRALALFQEWGFRSLGQQLQAEADRAPSQTELFAGPDELFPFGANAREAAADGAPEATWDATYHLVDTPERFEEMLTQLADQPRFAFDLETTDLRPLQAEVVGVAFSWREGEGWYVPVRGPEGCRLLDPGATLERLRPLFEDPGRAKVNQNIKYDLLVLRAAGIQVRGVDGDPMVADYLLHAGERSHGLEELSRRYLQHQVIPITDLIGRKSRKQDQLRMDQVPTDRVATYAGEDADVAWRLVGLLEKQLEQPAPGAGGGPAEGGSLRSLYDEVEVPLIEVLAEMEYNGIRLDVVLLNQLSEEMTRQLADIEREIYDLAGRPFSIASLPQLRKVLFDELKLPPQRKTGVTGAASTDQETLERLAALDHPGAALPRKILEHRQLSKLKSTYVDSLPQMVNPRTARVHTSFNQTVTSTGRLSASDPNLQNIPVRREMGQQIRQAFCPEPGWSLLTADYSQVELRLLAHFCGDDTLCRAFAEERDVHGMVAAEIFRVGDDLVTPEMRRMAKTVNFGVIYGMSAHGLAQRLRIPRDEAERFIDAYFARYPRVLEYQDRLLRDCRRRGHVSTILGRRRRIEGIRPGTTYQQRSQPEREAINMEIQGSAADLIKLAMLRVHRRLRAEKCTARLLLQIHDELVLEAPPRELPAVARLVREEMTAPLERALGLRTPLRVEVAAGPNWLDVETVAAAS